MLQTNVPYFMKKLLPLLLVFLTACQTPEPEETVSIGNRKIIAYWHSWNSRKAGYLPLSEVPPYVNQVNLAFAFPETAASERLVFPHANESDANMISDIRSLQRRGIDVLISLGGGNHPIQLKTDQERKEFVSSLIRLVKRYNFNGVDINLEGVSTVLEPGDLDFRNPTSPAIQQFIQAIVQVDTHFQERLILSVAPETQFVFGGYSKYGEEFGGYLPILLALRDRLDLVHVQLYNSGSMYAYTGDPQVPPTVIVEKGTPDFVVALTEMMILGFPVANDPDAYFPGFPAEKIVVGLPSTPAEYDSGTLSNDDFRLAMIRLLTGRTLYESEYVMRRPGGHPNLKGVMTWSLTWDARTESGRRPFDFVRTAAELFEEMLPSES